MTASPTTRPPAEPLAGVAPPEPPRKSLLWRALQALLRIACDLCFDLKVYGAHHIPDEGGVLVISNHQSYLDPVLLGLKIRRPMSYMARHGLFKNPLFGWLIRSLNAFPVRQGAGDVGAIREAVARLKAGHVLNVFPEGARSDDGSILPLQPGSALIVRKAAGVPVVPAVILGAYEAWDKRRSVPSCHKVRVMFGPPMDLAGLKGDAVLKVMSDTLNRMFAELKAKEDWRDRPR